LNLAATEKSPFHHYRQEVCAVLRAGFQKRTPTVTGMKLEAEPGVSGNADRSSDRTLGCPGGLLGQPPAALMSSMDGVAMDCPCAAQRNRAWLFLRKFVFEFTGQLVYVRCFTK
jgi:hypothetical protein